MQNSQSRRQILLACATGMLASANGKADAFSIGKSIQIQAGEDLMQEHGILGRTLLIYEELADLFEHDKPDPQDCLPGATEIIIKYVQGQHERVEELLIFPALTKANALPDLVSVLVTQHKVGHELTNTIKKKTEQGSHKTKQGRLDLANLLKMFSTMFRPHMLREDTVIFPRLHEIMNEAQYEELSTKVQSLESNMVNSTDLGSILRQLEGIEGALGIHNLAKFTAEIAPSNQT
jgi:hemerythrin-like domain-containing protein